MAYNTHKLENNPSSRLELLEEMYLKLESSGIPPEIPVKYRDFVAIRCPRIKTPGLDIEDLVDHPEEVLNSELKSNSVIRWE